MDQEGQFGLFSEFGSGEVNDNNDNSKGTMEMASLQGAMASNPLHETKKKKEQTREKTKGRAKGKALSLLAVATKKQDDNKIAVLGGGGIGDGVGGVGGEVGVGEVEVVEEAGGKK
ncbi:hypothetical protein TrLO_g5938 [Triparma laevis f. longispina]|uniref:Uncharacterized protein n=1 Tax=Triparma laevis f. longispina TaxID=1714387 RepID=A0A9W6ZSM8_9STRA|nr:hypothetical protein TrLO_g5938 [Triparma laevis f. longispina]